MFALYLAKFSFVAFRAFQIFLYISFFSYAMILDLYAEGQAVIEFPSLEHDFGIVNQGLKLNHDFTVKNTGNSDLIIREINPSCGCTAAVLEDPVVPPGKQTAIRVTFDTTGFAGIKSKTVRVYSNDPKKSSLVLRIKAKIMPEIVTEPPSLEIFNVKKGDQVDVSFVVRSTTDEPVPFKDVISKSEFVTATYDTNESGEILVHVTVSPKTPSGKLRSRIVVRTNNPRVPVVNVPILVDVVRDLTVDPKSVNFGYISSQIREPVRKEVRIGKIKGASDDLKIVKQSTTGSSYIKSTLVSSDGDTQVLHVDLLPGAEGVVRGVVLLETNHDDIDQRQIEVPVYAVVDNEKE